MTLALVVNSDPLDLLIYVIIILFIVLIGLKIIDRL